MVQGNHLEEPGFSLFSQVVMYQQLSTLLEYHGICWTHSSCAPPRNAPNPLSKKYVANYLRPLTIFKNLVAANYQIPS